MVKQLAVDYASQNVIFLEQPVDNPLGIRDDRWWAAFTGGTSPYLPLVMVDSGNQISVGPCTYDTVFRGLVDTSLARAAGGDLWATARRVDNHYSVVVRLRNASGVTLSSSNGATVHVLAYENVNAGVSNTMVRAAAYSYITTPVANGATATYSITTPDLATPADWANVHLVALVDYRPVEGVSTYDTLQAARVWIGRPARDFDGDGPSDIAVYRPSAGSWFSLDSSTGNKTFSTRGWGVNAQGDTPVVGDFDGDGVVDPAVFRPASGTWFVLKSSAAYLDWTWFGWGASGDTPVPGDYDGDGKTDGAVYRASTGTWYILPSSGATQTSVVFGQAGDVPIAGDFDGDRKRDPAVYRPSTGTWFYLKSSTNYSEYGSRGWGVDALGDTPAPGDYDGDGRTDLCVFRPSTGSWYILESNAGFTTWSHFGWGTTGDQVAPADYDGDGRTDGAVYRAATNTWYIRPSSGATQWNIVFGNSTDLPLVGIR